MEFFLRAFQKREEGAALHRAGKRHARGLTERRVEIKMADHRVAHLSGHRVAGILENQGNADAVVAQRALHVREGRAVIRCVEHKGVVLQPQLANAIENPAEAGVRPLGGGEELGKIAARLVRVRQTGGNFHIVRLDAGIDSLEGAVCVVQAEREEEGLFMRAAQKFHGFFRVACVGLQRGHTGRFLLKYVGVAKTGNVGRFMVDAAEHRFHPVRAQPAAEMAAVVMQGKAPVRQAVHTVLVRVQARHQSAAARRARRPAAECGAKDAALPSEAHEVGGDRVGVIGLDVPARVVCMQINQVQALLHL